ncbi:hypothetical protein [Heyndrickxia sporothermodurans]|uniref:hypothetical protein n=1 Tax=Heyndrickxia sporothermodurans TaxID=46224 RepID=UPI001F3EFA31|nr:hypothetical protein [Heyndrickxia sporothermodurans]
MLRSWAPFRGFDYQVGLVAPFLGFIPMLWRPSWTGCFVLGLHSETLTTKLDW